MTSCSSMYGAMTASDRSVKRTIRSHAPHQSSTACSMTGASFAHMPIYDSQGLEPGRPQRTVGMPFTPSFGAIYALGVFRRLVVAVCVRYDDFVPVFGGEHSIAKGVIASRASNEPDLADTDSFVHEHACVDVLVCTRNVNDYHYAREDGRSAREED